MDKKEFVAAAFKRFQLKLNTLPERIACQKTIYLLNELENKPLFTFGWHIFGPYSNELTNLSFSLINEEITNAKEIDENTAVIFSSVVKDFNRDSKFLEMLADICFLKKANPKISDENLFLTIVKHHDYLNDKDLFAIAKSRLASANLI